MTKFEEIINKLNQVMQKKEINELKTEYNRIEKKRLN